MMANTKINSLGIANGFKKRVEREYNCEPQIVIDDRRVGLNVHGREVGRVVSGEDGHIYGIYYTLGSQPEVSVFFW